MGPEEIVIYAAAAAAAAAVTTARKLRTARKRIDVFVSKNPEKQTMFETNCFSLILVDF